MICDEAISTLYNNSARHWPAERGVGPEPGTDIHSDQQVALRTLHAVQRRATVPPSTNTCLRDARPENRGDRDRRTNGVVQTALSSTTSLPVSVGYSRKRHGHLPISMSGTNSFMASIPGRPDQPFGAQRKIDRAEDLVLIEYTSTP